MEKYQHQEIEAKWQRRWEAEGVFRAKDAPTSPGPSPQDGRRGVYVLDMFPYPSGDGLHVGHPEGYTATDIVARYLRMKGKTVLHPMGWDAFGLPAENAAIKKGIHPRIVTEQNVKNFKRQIQSLGFSYDWSREINTTDPKYYKWTQWIFLQLFKMGLAYEAELPIWWCPKDKTGLANEEVVGGYCERCGTKVERKKLRQWVLKITAYAERLLKGLEKLDWPESIKALQRNWIGRSEGAEVEFEIETPKQVQADKKVLIGTRNAAKIEMITEALKGFAEFEFVSLKDLPDIDDSLLVEGDDDLENAKRKAEFYFQKSGLPTIATDHFLWIEKWPKNNGVISHIRKLVNPNSDRATDEEVLRWYKEFLKKVGGSSKSRFDYAIAYADASGTSVFRSEGRESILQMEQAFHYKEGYPTEALLKDPKTGEFRIDQDKDIQHESITQFLRTKVRDRMLENRRVKVFTTRPDTLFGATYLVLSPEHPLVDAITTAEQRKAVEKYKKEVASKSDLERTALEKEKTGVFTGAYAINPVNNEKIPVWIADYVLMSYGTGAIMAVPAHDERDFEFAKKFKLPIREVIIPSRIDHRHPPRPNKKTIERWNVHALVTHPKTGKILALQWTKHPWITFPMGGVDDGEDIVEAARREVYEETGYKKLRFINVLGGPVKGEYFAAHKDENRIAYTQLVSFTLQDEEQDQVRPSELAEYKVIWLDPADLPKKMMHVEIDIWLERLKNGPTAYVGEGSLINSGNFNGLPSEEGRKKITAWLESHGHGIAKVNYKLRDWVFSRQRYWGEPIPLLHCPTDGVVPLPENELPVVLPSVERYQPTGTGESPLAGIKKWVNVPCPRCGKPGERETNTMPQWAGSCWYYLCYLDPKNEKNFFHFPKQRPAIGLSDHDRNVISEFSKIYQHLDARGIEVWAANRLQLNGLNRTVWYPLNMISIMAISSNFDEVRKTCIAFGYSEKSKGRYGIILEKGDIQIDLIEIFEDERGMYSLTLHGSRVDVTLPDIPPALLGELDGFRFRTVSPRYSLRHYEYVQAHESATRLGKGDEQKIKFLQEWENAANEKFKRWLPVDLYVGGAEHAVLHLLYARFWHMALYDAGVIPKECGDEPFMKLKNQGLILGEDGEKMSKSRGNVINPDEIIEKYGADTLRMYEMFMGPFEDAKPWDTNRIVGVRRFLEKVWKASSLVTQSSSPPVAELPGRVHRNVKQITDGIENFRFNTCVSDMMKWVNEWTPTTPPLGAARDTPPQAGGVGREEFEVFLKLLSPFAPHIVEELWFKLGHDTLLAQEQWPTYDPKKIKEETVTIAVQVMGKLRGTITVSSGASQSEVETLAKAEPNVTKYLTSKPKKVIFVKDELINFVI